MYLLRPCLWGGWKVIKGVPYLICLEFVQGCGYILYSIMTPGVDSDCIYMGMSTYYLKVHPSTIIFIVLVLVLLLIPPPPPSSFSGSRVVYHLYT